ARSWSLDGSLKLKNMLGYGNNWYSSLSYGWDQTTKISTGVSLPKFMRRQLGYNLLSHLKYTFKINNRNSSVRPTKGFAFVSTSQLGGVFLDSRSVRYIRQLKEFDLLKWDQQVVSELVKNLFLLKDMNQDSAHMVAASKVPMLKLGVYEIWRMSIEQYIQMIDYALWEVIENDATLPKTKIMERVMTEMPITTAEEKATRRLEVKAKSTLMMGIPNEHQLKFNSINDAKKLLEAVEKRFGRNEATKKTQRNLLKQQYENFTAPSSEMLDQTFDKLQKLVSQLELLGEKILQENVNQKLLRSLSPEWNTHVVVWRNKVDLDTMSMDDLYNNLKVYEPKVKGMSSSSSSTQNMAFVSSSNNNTSGTNETINTTHGVSTASTQVNASNSTNINNLSDAIICSFFASQPNSPQLVHEDLQQIHPDDMEKMNLRWQMAMLTMRARSPKWSATTATTGDTLLGSAELQEIKTTRTRRAQEGVCLKKHPLPQLWCHVMVLVDMTGMSLLNKPVVENRKSDEEVSKVVRKSNDSPIIEDWVSDSEEENVSQTKTEKKTVKPSIAKIELFKHTHQEQKLTRENGKQLRT
ncbi:putative ribonuclease H-like domain-containing protein, partial [Tanacetum coccineum]